MKALMHIFGSSMDFTVEFTEECLRLYYLLEAGASIDSIRAWFITKEHHPNPELRDLNQYLTWKHPQSSLSPFSLVVTKDRLDILRLLHQAGVDLASKKLVGRFVGSSTILAAASYKYDILKYLFVDGSLACRQLPEVTSLFSLTPCHPPSTQHFIHTCQVILNQPLGRLFARSLYVNWHWLAIQEHTEPTELAYFLTAFGHGPYMGCTLPTLFYSACCVRNLALVQGLLEYDGGKLFNGYIDDSKGSRQAALLELLVYATIEDFLPAVKHLLSLDSSLVNMAFGNWNTTLLMLASYCRAQKVVEYLCFCTNVHVSDSTGCTALHYAIAGRHLSIVQYLMEQAGATVQETIKQLHEKDEVLCRRPPVACIQYSLSHMRVGGQRILKDNILSYISRRSCQQLISTA
eukprot:gene25398-30668_t